MLEKIQETAAFLKEKMHTNPETAIILGTGLGSLVHEIIFFFLGQLVDQQLIDLVALQDELLFHQFGAQPVGRAQFQTEQFAVQPLYGAAHGAVTIGLFGNAGAVLGLLAGPCLAAQHSSHRPLPHGAGQVVGQLLRHLAAFIGNGIAVAGQGDQRLLCDIVQTGADLKIVDKGFLHQGVLDLLPGNGTGVFHQIAQQQPDLGAAGQAAGTDTGGKSIIGAHRSLHPPCAFTWYQRSAPLPKGRAAGRQKLFLLV